MSRHVLTEDRIHPAVRDYIHNHYRLAIEEVGRATRDHAIVIVGMRQNPFPRRARTLLDKQGLTYKYFEFGSYLSGWRLRNAIKMWTGWPTIPIIFVRGKLVGGFEDLKRLADKGELVFDGTST
ncbi:MAG: glutaredoxin [Betaproteobacteria bacterium]|nr:glutaredoxin [Betaproteobacteria bacterium]